MGVVEIIEGITSDNGGGSGGDSLIVKGSTPPNDTQKIWYNTNDNIIYYYDTNAWLSEQIYETIFNDQGSTPNNTFFRCGNTVGNSSGSGYNISFNCRVLGLSFARNPNTAKTGQYWLYSNRDTGTNFASVIASFVVNTSGRGFILPNLETDINESNYISIRWNGQETNNNVVTLRYRKKYTS